MDKIFLIYNKSSYKKKWRIYKSEAELIKDINPSSSGEIFEYQLASKRASGEYFKSKERDTQLRNILGELSESETSSMDLIQLFETLAKDNKKVIHLNNLKKFLGDKKSFANYLVNNKKYFFKVSSSLEWVLAILKCHNFQRYYYDSPKWNSEEKKYIKVDTSTEELRQNFKLAKEELKKLKKKSS
jgi:hypothetical protein